VAWRALIAEAGAGRAAGAQAPGARLRDRKVGRHDCLHALLPADAHAHVRRLPAGTHALRAGAAGLTGDRSLCV